MSVIKVSSIEALSLHERGIRFLDVRSVPEFEGGHAPGAYNIPLMHMSSGRMQPNPKFEQEVEAAFAKDKPVMVACKAGGRSARAAAMLQAMGYTTIYDYGGGWGGNAEDPGWPASGGASTTEVTAGRAYADLSK